MKNLTFFLSIILMLIVADGCKKPNDYATICGYVTDKETQEPIKGAMISIQAIDNKRVTNENRVTNEKGYYKFKNLYPRKYNIQVTAHGYITDRKNDFEALTGVPNEVNFQLEKE